MEPVEQTGPETVHVAQPDATLTGGDQEQRPRPRTALAAAVSAALLSLIFLMNAGREQEEPSAPDARSGRREVFNVEVVGKTSLMLQGPARRHKLPDFLRKAPVRTVQGRAAVVALLYAQGLEGHAYIKLAELKQLMQEYPDEVTEQDRQLVETLEAVLRAADETQITPEQEELVLEKLGWCGQALLARKKGDTSWFRRQEYRTLRALGILILAFFCLILAFVGGIVAWIVLLYEATLRPGYLQFGPPRLHPGFYLEAFAAVLALFIAGQFVLPALVPNPIAGAFLSQGFALLGLAVLRRTREPAQVWLEDTGLSAGQLLRRLREGIKVYALALPALFVGATYTFLLSRFVPQISEPSSPLAPGPQPAHPAIDMVLQGNTAQLILLFLTAVVGAPIVEEILFRGLLYRFARHYTGFLSRGWSIFWSSLLTGVIFAVIHPQGLLAAPALTGLAAAFAVGRERYGSLIPSMVAHAINNTVVLFVVLLIVF